MRVVFGFLVFCLVMGTGSTFGQTIITGPITESQHWDLAGSPYVVQGEVWMDNHLSLTIDPGVEVLMDSGALIGVQRNCVVDAQGTAQNPIVFSSNSPSPQPGDYDGVYLGSYETTTMANCVIEYARTGLPLNYPLSVDNVEIRNCVDGIMAGVIQGDISGFYIHDNTRFGISCDVLTSAMIRDCTIIGNGLDGIRTAAESTTVGASNCSVKDNGREGIVASWNVDNCLISGNGGIGLILIGGVKAEYNTITDNAGYGVGVRDVYPGEIVAVNKCNIFDNGEYDFAVAINCFAPIVDATNNFWGTQDGSLIASRILDTNSDPQLTSVVDFTPFEATVGVEKSSWGSVKSLYR